MSFRKTVFVLALVSASVPAAFASNGVPSAVRQTSVAATEISNATTGVSMRMAKRSDSPVQTRQMSTQPDARIQLTGVPMVVAKRSNLSAQARWTATQSNTSIQLTGASMVVAKRPLHLI